MEEYKVLFMRIREFFRRNPQTNWGKNQIISILDEIEEKIDEEKNYESAKQHEFNCQDRYK